MASVAALLGRSTIGGGKTAVVSVECPDFYCIEVCQVNEASDTEN